MLYGLACVFADFFGHAVRIADARGDLELIAAYGDKAEVPAMSGWQFKVFGKEALELRDGKLALAIEENRLKLVKTG